MDEILKYLVYFHQHVLTFFNNFVNDQFSFLAINNIFYKFQRVSLV